MNIKHLNSAPPPPHNSLSGGRQVVGDLFSNLFTKLFGVKLVTKLIAILLIATLSNSGYAAHNQHIHQVSARSPMPLLPLAASITLPSAINPFRVPNDYDGFGDRLSLFDLDDYAPSGVMLDGTAQIIRQVSNGCTDCVQISLRDNEINALFYTPDESAADSVVEIAVSDYYNVAEYEFVFSVIVGNPNQNQVASTVRRRKHSDDKFDDFAIYSGVAILSTWAFNQYGLPGFSDRIKFQAKPTSNKNLQYQLSADINKNWSANFTVDKQVKINNETNNSNLYKLKFEYKF